MSKLTKKQKKIAEMMEGFAQPCTSAIDAIQKLQEVAKETCKFNVNNSSRGEPSVNTISASQNLIHLSTGSGS